MATRRARRTPQTVEKDAPTEGLPIVAIVGRPNVGKSTLFNRIVGDRVAIVEDRARTTRDRLYDVAEWNGRRFVVVDTGGLETRPGDPIEERVQEQARVAIAEADTIVFVVDAGNKVVYRPIQLGAMAEGQRVVESGLKAGDKIVVNGLQRIRPGAIVAPELEQKVAASQ